VRPSISKMQLDVSLGACDVAVSSSRRRQLIAETAYDVTVLVSPATVDATTLTAALETSPRKASSRRPRKPTRLTRLESY
jgi:hypothetical protein